MTRTNNDGRPARARALPLPPVAWMLAALLLSACEDDPSGPRGQGMVVLQALATEFTETDVNVGTDEVLTVEVRNDGDEPLQLTGIELVGQDAGAFAFLGGETPGSLAGGARREILVGFRPDSEGLKSVDLTLHTSDPANARVDIRMTGRAARFQYHQVDRMGIPGLNTVFNHPSGIAGFDKTAYNRASPAADLATYAAQFEVVLGAVGNADPAGTAALLLPDELPVSMAAAPTQFATLTGRALSDDAVDVALFVTVGVPALQSDNVDANDKAFRVGFPYVALPH